jgi:hypothetical protein
MPLILCEFHSGDWGIGGQPLTTQDVRPAALVVLSDE